MSSLTPARYAIARLGCLFTAVGGLASTAAAQAPSENVGYSIEFPADGSVQHVSIGRGQEGSFSFRIRASGPGYAHVHSGVRRVQGRLADYTFLPRNPERCEAPSLASVSSSPFESMRFRVGPLSADESFECVYRVVRSGVSSSDLGFHLCHRGDWFCSRRIRMGSLPDVTVSAAPVLQSDARGLQFARLTVHNQSSESIHAADLHTGCHEFGGGQGGGIAFVFEYDFPGACPLGRSEPCVNFTGQNFGSYGFAVGPIPPRSSASCLLGMRPVNTGRRSAMSTSLALFEDELILAGDGVAFDPNAENNEAHVGVGLVPASVGTPVDVGRASTWLAVTALMIPGLLVLLARRHA